MGQTLLSLAFGTFTVPPYGHKIQWNYSLTANTFKYYSKIWGAHWCRLPNSSEEENEPALSLKKIKYPKWFTGFGSYHGAELEACCFHKWRFYRPLREVVYSCFIHYPNEVVVTFLFLLSLPVKHLLSPVCILEEIGFRPFFWLQSDYYS